MRKGWVIWRARRSASRECPMRTVWAVRKGRRRAWMVVRVCVAVAIFAGVTPE